MIYHSKIPRIKEYSNIVCELFGVPEQDLFDAVTRLRQIVYARRLLIWLIKTDPEGGGTFQSIGNLFASTSKSGKMDHATVLHHYKQARSSMNAKVNGKFIDPEFRRMMLEAEEFRNMVLGKFKQIDSVYSDNLWLYQDNLISTIKDLEKQLEAVRGKIKDLYEPSEKVREKALKSV